MGPPSIWATLGIEATRDRAAIRRAYAARLKVTSPEDDAAGFQALRAAYERALAYAEPAPRGRGGARIVVDPPPPEPERDEAERSEDQPEAGAAARLRAWRPPTDGADAPDEEVAAKGARPHDWRAPEPDQPPEAERKQDTGARPRRWRPPPEPELPPEIFDAATREAYDRRVHVLTQLVADASATDDARVAALRAVLASPMLEDVARHDAAEAWIARLIQSNIPRGDALIEPAVRYFGWDSRRIGPKSGLGAPVLARRDDLQFLAGTGAIGNPHQGARVALSRKPAGWRRWAVRLTPGLPGRVRAFLRVVRLERPGLMASLDPEAVAWWDDHFSRPRLGPISIWLATAVPAVVALLAFFMDFTSNEKLFQPVLVYLGCLGGIGGAVALNHYGVEWPRFLWRQRWRRRAPAWVEVGWAPALGVLLLLAAAIPASAAATSALLLAAVLLALWAVAVGEPDQRPLGRAAPGFRWRGPIISFPIAFGIYVAYWGLIRPNVRFPWQTRAAFAFFYLAVYWLLLADELPAAVWLQMAAPLAAAIAGFTIGAGTLNERWQRLAWRIRPGAVAGLALMSLTALAALWLGRDFPTARPIAAALVTLAVFAHKAPAEALPLGAQRLRDAVMRYGWFLIFTVARAPDAAAVVGLYAMTGIVALVIGARQRRQRAERGQRMAALRRALAAVLRYGWVAAMPLLLLPLARPTTEALVGGALWLLAGVGVTIAALAPPAPRR